MILFSLPILSVDTLELRSSLTVFITLSLSHRTQDRRYFEGEGLSSGQYLTYLDSVPTGGSDFFPIPSPNYTMRHIFKDILQYFMLAVHKKSVSNKNDVRCCGWSSIVYIYECKMESEHSTILHLSWIHKQRR